MLRPVANPPNPWHGSYVEWLDEPPAAELHVFEEDARSILSENRSPDVGFRFSINPYRGCFHGCAYCYARPSHQYLDWGAGTDFDRKIVVKRNAPELLRAAFERPAWRGETIALSGNTDCYQPLEASYGLTRGLLQVFLEYRNPVGLITKSSLIRRDIDVLAELARHAPVSVFISIPFADDHARRKIEPYASAIGKRFETLCLLSEAGVPCGVALAPLIPGLNDADIPTILEKSAEAGASRAFMTLLRLPKEVKPVFEQRLRDAYPERYPKVFKALAAMREGRLQDPRFGHRMRGEGARWDAIRALFDMHARRLGLNAGEAADTGITEQESFRRPRRQLSLFEG